MLDPREVRCGTDSDQAGNKASHKLAQFDEAALLQKLYWTVPETAFQLRVAVRTVWRLMADPKSCFPKPRRVRGRTLLVRDEVIAFLAKGGSR
jgi:hypothetical protein